MSRKAEPRRLRDVPWLAAGPLPKLLGILDRDGEEARVVGGAVRNALLGEPAGEVDVATTAVPETVMRRAAGAGWKAVPTGIDHGTVTVVADGVPFEVTTLRQDVETFGRKASVRFGRDWTADAERRDFTMNALSVSRDGAVHDPVGGLADLQARRVRFIGDPATRIREDYLRILRFFRFQAAYGRGAPDAAGLQAATALRDGLDRLSRERIRMEMIKLLVAPGAAAALEAMADYGILVRVLAAVPVGPSFARMAALEAALGLPADPMRRLGALAVHVTEDAERLAQRLRLTKAEAESLFAMADRWWHVPEHLPQPAARALLYRLGPPRYRDRVLFAWMRAGAAADHPAWRALATLPGRWQAPKFPLRAADFTARGVAKGRALGAALAAAESAWIAADFPLDKGSLTQLADRAAHPPAG